MKNYNELYNELNKQHSRTIFLIGVSYALLDFFEKYDLNLNNAIIMETGGMKGRKKEITREELHEKLKKLTKTNFIHSEYSMTELMSQAYSFKEGIYKSPPWMKIIIRDIQDPFNLNLYNVQGGVNIIDLANIDSCSFIASQDLGIKTGKTFQILGRIDNSDIRGCNLLLS
ncbi:MAG: hypothetical protein H0U27_04185 [Nitrosopumilus sp.]|nr:hypothetical protein [Nitrosopumilus sp.]